MKVIPINKIKTLAKFTPINYKFEYKGVTFNSIKIIDMNILSVKIDGIYKTINVTYDK